MILIEIPGEPVAMGRPRAVAVPNKMGGRPIVRMYQPKKGTTWKATAQDHMMAALRRWGFDRPYIPEGPVRLVVWAVFTCPKGDYRKTMEVPPRWRDKQPDGDNVLKAVKDAGSGVLWLDDNQVASATINTVTAGQRQAPRVIVEVSPITEPVPLEAVLAPLTPPASASS